MLLGDSKKPLAGNSSSAAHSATSEKPSSETILLVEDEECVRELVRETLTIRGYKILEAEDGEAGLRVAQSHQGGIDLLITDVVMPGISGQELAQKLAVLRPGLKVLYLSGYPEDTVFGKHPLGVRAAFLQKPFTLPDLARKVGDFLRANARSASASS